MTVDLHQIESVRKELAALHDRAEEIIREASSYKSAPYVSPESAVLLATQLADQSKSLIYEAANKLAILKPELQRPISELHGVYLGVECEREAEKLRADPKEVSTANLAFAQRMVRVISGLLSSAHACLEGTETLSGEKLRRSPMYDK